MLCTILYGYGQVLWCTALLGSDETDETNLISHVSLLIREHFLEKDASSSKWSSGFIRQYVDYPLVL